MKSEKKRRRGTEVKRGEKKREKTEKGKKRNEKEKSEQMGGRAVK